MWRSNVLPKVLFHGFLQVLQSGFTAQTFVPGLVSVQKPLALKPGWVALPQGNCQAESYCRDWTSALKSPHEVKRLPTLMAGQPGDRFLIWSTATTKKRPTLVLLKIILVIKPPKCLRTAFDAPLTSTEDLPTVEKAVFSSRVFSPCANRQSDF